MIDDLPWEHGAQLQLQPELVERLPRALDRPGDDAGGGAGLLGPTKCSLHTRSQWGLWSYPGEKFSEYFHQDTLLLGQILLFLGSWTALGG